MLETGAVVRLWKNAQYLTERDSHGETWLPEYLRGKTLG
jgi:hypothetical protein